MSASLEESYKYCRELNRRFGSTYYWATAVLPAAKRKHVHALYGFCRYADDIVDGLNDVSLNNRVAALSEFGDRFFVDLESGRSDDPVLYATIDTVKALDINPDCIRRFLHSMHMDFTVTTYETFDDLMEYMDGSAAVIGEMMLPILEPVSKQAVEPARQLGIAFQLTNFLRDVGEDLQRGRVYIPQETLRKFDADPHRRTNDAGWVEAMQFEIARTREIYADADKGLGLLPAQSAKSIRAARDLYSGILKQIETNNYDVFTQRARVPGWKKLVAAGKMKI